DAGLAAGSPHSYVVVAVDAAGNASPASAPASATTAAAPGSPFPMRAAVYYPWFPEAWNQQGFNPFTMYHPSLGFYDSSAPAVIRQHIEAMKYGKIAAGISSWWGQGTMTDGRVSALLAGAAGTGFRWTLYYEPEGSADPSVAQIRADLTYIRDRYAGDPSFLRIDGRFVIFVWAQAGDACAMADRWKQANTVGAYLVLKVFVGFKGCASQPDGWHQYGPAVPASNQAPYSFTISPSFNKPGEPGPRLDRDLSRWRANIRAMIASGASFQLVTTFSEWGEGTAVESATEWASASGYGDYLDALHTDGAEH
ncbi:MAG: hypothetical protein QOK40_1247, partial [Miltoncostaeaceae bacterium]|nr:hypothetical protein [Miltoncostaeaceae bacterium]